jgi:glutaminyl-peptide cyclotransferase
VNPRHGRFLVAILLGLAVFIVSGCNSKADGTAASLVSAAPIPPQSQSNDDAAPPSEKTGGFDGKRAFAQVAKQVSFGPRPSGSPAIAQLQQYLQSELTSYGCKVDPDDFHAETPVGRLAMKNIVAKIPGEKPGIIILATHYDTKRLENFVGADDAGSSAGVMLELARLLCTKRDRYAVWIVFFDGEEAVNWDWKDPDNCYGSRQMAAKLAMSGDLQKIKAFMLADIVGTRPPRFKRESDSTKWLVDLIWGVAKKLGYGDVFLDQSAAMSDDHDPFLKRNVPAADVIDLENYPGGNLYYWHTPQDTLDKVSPRSLAITGHVFLESLRQLQSQ